MIVPDKEWLNIFKSVNGALSVTEAVAIMNIAAAAPDGLWFEFGTYKGKSAISAAYGVNKTKDFYLVDPEFKNEEFYDDAYLIISKYCNPHLISDISTNVIDKFNNYSYVFVDSGSHQDGLPMREVKLLEDRIVQGGIIAFHDLNSQFIEVKEAYDYLLSTKKYAEIKIDWPTIIAYVNEHNLEDGNISWHHPEVKNPCFVGALMKL